MDTVPLPVIEIERLLTTGDVAEHKYKVPSGFMQIVVPSGFTHPTVLAVATEHCACTNIGNHNNSHRSFIILLPLPLTEQHRTDQVALVAKLSSSVTSDARFAMRPAWSGDIGMDRGCLWHIVRSSDIRDDTARHPQPTPMSLYALQWAY